MSDWQIVSQLFIVHNALKTGDALSPLLFIFALYNATTGSKESTKFQNRSG